MNKSFALLCAALLCALWSYADVEPNNSIAQAESAALGSLNGTVEDGVDENDYYLFTLTENGLISADVSFDNGTGRLIFYNSDGSQISFSGSGSTASLSSDCIAVGSWYVRVEYFGSGTANYSLNAVLTPANLSNDAEPNNGFSDAAPLTVGVEQTGQLGYVNGAASPLDDDDYYVTVAGANGRLTCTVVGDNSLNQRIVLYNQDFLQLAFSGFSGTADTAVLVWDCVANDTIYWRVDQGGGCGSYTISYSVEEPLYANDAEPNNDFDSALPLAPSTTVSGQLGYVNGTEMPTDVDDYYVTVLESSGRITATVYGDNNLNKRIVLYDKDRVQLAFTGSALGTDTATLVYDCLAADTIYLRIDQTGGCGSYELSYGISSLTYANDAEPNDNVPSAVAVSLDTPIEGQIGYSNGASRFDDDDFYQVDLPVNGSLQADLLLDDDLSARILFYNADGTQISFSGSSTLSNSLFLDCLASGTYYVQVEQSADCGSYQLMLTQQTSIYADDIEPNSSIFDAIPISEGIAVEGRLGYQNGTVSPFDDDDYYVTVLSDDGFVSANAISDNGLTQRLLIYNSDRVLLTFGGSSDTSSVGASCVAGDTVYVQIEHSSGCGGYTLTMDLQAPSFEQDAEPNNNISEINTTLQPNIALEGHIGYTNGDANPFDDDDFYAFELESDGLMDFELIFADGATGRLLIYKNSSLQTFAGSSDTVLFSSVLTDTSASWAVQVEQSSGCGGYSLRLDNGCPQPEDLNTQKISVAARLKWGPVAEATSYEVQTRLDGTTAWETTERPVSSYIYAFIEECTDYEWRVQSLCGDRSSSYTATQDFTTLCAPFCPALTGVSVSEITDTTARVSWDPLFVSTGYRVEYRVAGGPGGFAIPVPSTDTTAVIMDLDPATDYEFRVVSNCYGDGTSPYVNGSFTTLSARSGEIVAAILPNPSSDWVYLQASSAENGKYILEVFDLSGKRVDTQQV
jgi:hypothetical protein